MRILAYSSATEIGLVVASDEVLYLVEGPIIDDFPFRWIKPVEKDASYAVFTALVEDARRHL